MTVMTKTDIPLVDLKAQYRTIKEEVRAAIDDVLEGMQLNIGGRMERVRKESSDLVLPASAGVDAANVTELAFGYARDLNRTGALRLGVGVRGAVNFIPAALGDA